MRNWRVLKARNPECKDESIYETMQAWGTMRDETYKLIAENPMFETRSEVKFEGNELTVNAVKYVSSSQHAINIEKVPFECNAFNDDWITVPGSSR